MVRDLWAGSVKFICYFAHVASGVVFGQGGQYSGGVVARADISQREEKCVS